MKIGLIGYGKMGKTVEKIAMERGHILSIGITPDVDAFIDFTEPAAVIKTAQALQGKKIPWIIGTTGWDPSEVLPLVKKWEIPFLYSPNFSIGMAIFSRLAKMVGGDFSVRGEETHHKEKKDVPSGTARKLMHEIKGLTFDSIREGDSFGIHKIVFENDVDQIELIHRAKNREGFAKGAVLSAEWMIGKEGTYTFDDYLEEMWNAQELLQPLLLR